MLLPSFGKLRQVVDKDKEVIVGVLFLSLSVWDGGFGGMFEGLVSR